MTAAESVGPRTGLGLRMRMGAGRKGGRTWGVSRPGWGSAQSFNSMSILLDWAFTSFSTSEVLAI